MMITKLITFIAMLCVFGTNAFMSVFGFRAFIANDPVVATFFSIGFELGKLQLVFYLHRRWGELRWFGGRTALIAIIAVLVSFTTAEVIGYLSLGYKTSVSDYQNSGAKDRGLETERIAIKEELVEFDKMTASWPDNWYTKRIRAKETIGYDKKRARLQEIAQLQTQIKSSKGIEYAGPVFATAKIFNIEPDIIAKWFIVLAVMISEPLSIALAVATSALWLNRKKPEIVKTKKAERADIDEESISGHSLAKQIVKAEKAKKADTEKAKKPDMVFQKEFHDIVNRYNMNIHKIAKVCKIRRIETVQRWLVDEKLIPEKQVRMLRKWDIEQRAQAPQMVIVK